MNISRELKVQSESMHHTNSQIAGAQWATRHLERAIWDARTHGEMRLDQTRAHMAAMDRTTRMAQQEEGRKARRRTRAFQRELLLKSEYSNRLHARKRREIAERTRKRSYYVAEMARKQRRAETRKEKREKMWARARARRRERRTKKRKVCVAVYMLCCPMTT